MSIPQAKILLVDDFSMVRASIKNILKDLGITNIHEAKDGQQALDLLSEAQSNKDPFDLVFCDWNMPNMSGIEMLKEVKAKPELSDLPIVMVTAERDRANVVQALKQGAKDYVVKPFNKAQISKKIERILMQTPTRASA